MSNYHEDAQKFIKSSKAKGYGVKAEGGELIAYPPGTPKPKAPTPFEMVGGGIRRFGRLIKSGINKVGETVADDLFGSSKDNDKNKEIGEKLNQDYSGKRRSTSNGSMR